MKTNIFWIGLFVVIFMVVGLAFPYMLWKEFGWTAFDTPMPQGGTKGFAGLSDYMRLYPHMVIYPACWSFFTFLNLGIGFSAISSYSHQTKRPIAWHATLLVAFLIFAAISAAAAVFESRNPAMMLFELSKETQQKPIGEVVNNTDTQVGQATFAESVFRTIDTSQDPIDFFVPQPIREQAFNWKKTWKSKFELLSDSRPYYIVTFAGLIWAALTVVLSAVIAAVLHKGVARRRLVTTAIGAAIGLCLWFPHRVYYNRTVKAKMFGKLDNSFDFWIPEKLEKYFTTTESLLLLIGAVFFFIVVAIVLKKDPKSLVRQGLQWLTFFGIGSASLWGILDPQAFGKALGLVNGDWSKLIVFTLMLIFFFTLQWVFTVLQEEEDDQTAI